MRTENTAVATPHSGPLLTCTGILFRDQPHIAADLLSALEPFPTADDQDIGKCRERAHARMGHQPQNLGPLPGLPLDRSRQLFNRRIHSVQQLEQIQPAPQCPGSERKPFQLCSSLLVPQLFSSVAALRSSPKPVTDS